MRFADMLTELPDGRLRAISAGSTT